MIHRTKQTSKIAVCLSLLSVFFFSACSDNFDERLSSEPSAAANTARVVIDAPSANAASPADQAYTDPLSKLHTDKPDKHPYPPIAVPEYVDPSAVRQRADSPDASTAIVAKAAVISDTFHPFIDVYTNRNSVTPGQTIQFHVSDNAGTVGVNRSADVTVDRIGAFDQRYYAGSAVMTKQIFPANAWRDCCNWPVSLALTIPANWATGLYRATFSPPSGSSTRTYFVVRQAAPASRSKVVLQVPFDTANAYTNWGGKSAYTFNSTGDVGGQILSMHRPTGSSQDDEFFRWILPLVRWAEGQGMAFEYLSSSDLEAESFVLSPYELFITAGHDEYWSGPMRAELQRFVSAGGNAAILSGNTMWWKTEFITDGLGRARGQMRITKESGSSTSNWYEHQPEAALLGVSWLRGGYVDEVAEPGLTNNGYSVIEPGHFLFAGTGLAESSQFGAAQRILRYEADGIDFFYNALGKPVPTGGDGAPLNTTILALGSLGGWYSPGTSPPSHPNINLTGIPEAFAAMTIHSVANGGGSVFNGGTTDWVRGLVPCIGASNGASPVCQITRNAINTFSAIGSNTAPDLVSPGNQSTATGSSVNISLAASDADNDPLTFAATGLPDGVTLAISGQISGTVAATAVTSTTVITVTDGRGGIDTVKFVWNVPGSTNNELATIVSPTPGSTLSAATVPFTWTAGEGDLYCLSVDSPGLPSIYAQCTTQTSATVSNLPTGGELLFVNLQTRINLVWQASISFNYTASSGTPTNGNPVITVPPARSDNVGSNIALQISASDPDADPLTFSAAGLPAGLSIATNGFISGVIAEPTGVYTVNVSVSDGQGGSASGQFQWTVTPDTSSVATMIAPVPNTVLSGDSINFSWTNGNGDLYCLSVDSPGLPTLSATCLSGTTQTVAGLPTNGETLIVNLQTRQNLVWQTPIEYLYTAASGSGGGDAPSTMIAPVGGAVLPAGAVSFSWTDQGGDLYCLSADSPGQPTLFAQCLTGNSITVPGLPTGGVPIIVNLQTRLNLVWQTPLEYHYTSAN